ncbi:MAG TPA: arginine--tRNA ligase, partial [Clostridia bacterium]
MTNLVENVKHEIKSVVEKALAASIAKGELAEVPIPEILVEVPREKEHGDFSANTAMLLTRQLKKAPREIAQTIIKNMDFTGTFIEKVECAGPGFINFYLSNKWLYKSLDIVVSENEDYGRINIGNGKKVMVEYVSANPTGPLHMGNARGGALGDCIASVLDAAGYDVTREFYINDAGNQIEKFGISLEARYLQLILGEDAVSFPEDGYMGEDIIDHMKNYIALFGDKLINTEPSRRQKELVDFALPRNIENIKNALSSYGVNHDVWFSEKTLHDSGAIDEAIKMLIEKGATVEKEGALWLKASVIGAEKDEVLVRNNGIPTYFAADIAYHMNKFLKRGFDRVINLWGADHHGHVSRMKGAMAALGIDPSRLDVVLFQLVRLY